MNTPVLSQHSCRAEHCKLAVICSGKPSDRCCKCWAMHDTVTSAVSLDWVHDGLMMCNLHSEHLLPAVVDQVLLDRFNMLMEEGACPSAACTPTTMPAARPAAPTAGHPAQAFFAGDKADSSASSSNANLLGTTGLGTGSRGQPSSQPVSTHHGWHHSSNAAAFSEPAETASTSAAIKATPHSKPHATGGSSSPMSIGKDAAGAARGGKKQAGSRKPTRGLIEVSTSGGLSKSVMQSSPQSILEELEVTLG